MFIYALYIYSFLYIYIYSFLTKTTIICHYTVFVDYFQSSDGYNSSSFSEKQISKCK